MPWGIPETSVSPVYSSPLETALGQVINRVRGRPVNMRRVGFDQKPFDIFVFRNGDARLVGIKTAARVSTDPDVPRRKCCLIEPTMVLGLLESTRVDAGGYTLFFRPMEGAEVHAFMSSACEAADLSYPFARLDFSSGGETAQPRSYWSSCVNSLADLDRGEDVLRRHAITRLKEILIEPCLVYDPACSSGRFLSSLKAAYPHIDTVGQDIDYAMIDVARKFIDKVHLGDSINPAIRDGCADLVVCRHLNLDVVISQQAEALFLAAARTAKLGGHILVVGHTPILLAGEWFEAQGFVAITCCGFTPTRSAAFQFYLLRRRGDTIAKPVSCPT